MNMTNKLYTTVFASTALLLAVAAPGADKALAATSCKPALTAKGMFYTTKGKARSSADYRWGLKAASVHGAGWALVGQAKGKSYKCTFGHGKKGQLYNCSLTARPCRQVTTCKGFVSAKGMFYTGVPKAEESARYRWGLKAAQVHGAKYAHWGRARNKSVKCTSGHGKKGNLHNCVARAKACN